MRILATTAVVVPIEAAAAAAAVATEEEEVAGAAGAGAEIFGVALPTAEARLVFGVAERGGTTCWCWGGA